MDEFISVAGIAILAWFILLAIRVAIFGS